MHVSVTIRTLPFARLRAPERVQQIEEIALLVSLLSAATLTAPYLFAIANHVAGM